MVETPAKSSPETAGFADVESVLSEIDAALIAGRYALALTLSNGAIEAAEAGPGAASCTTGRVMVARSKALYEYAEYDEALDMAVRAVRIHRFADCLVDLVDSLHQRGRVQLASDDSAAGQDALEESLDLAKDLHGAGTVPVARILNDLGRLDVSRSRYDAGRQKYEEALRVFERELGPRNVHVAGVLSDLGEMHWLMGAPRQALRLHEEAREMLASMVGTEHPDYGDVLANLAVTHQGLEQNEIAERLHGEALRVTETALGQNHPLGATIQNNLGVLYRTLGDYDKALPLLERARGIWRTKLGDDHSTVAYATSNLALLFQWTGRALEASRLLGEVLRVRLDALGPDHPLVAQTYFRMAVNEYLRGNYDQSVRMAVRAESINRAHVVRAVEKLPEDEALKLRGPSVQALHTLLSMAILTESRSGRRAAVDSVIRFRNVVLDEIARRRRLSPGLSASEHVATGGETDALFDERAEAERRAARAMESARKWEERDSLGFDDVLEALPPSSALISYFRYHEYSGQRLPVDSYGAFWLLPSGEFDLLRLGDAASIDEQIEGVRRELIRPRRSVAEYRQQAEGLRRVIWDPVAGPLSDVDSILIVPDDKLGLINFGALPVRGGYLVGRRTRLHYLSAERDVVRFAEPPSHRNREFLAVDRVFAQSSGGASGWMPALLRPLANLLRGGPACFDAAEVRWAPLPPEAPLFSHFVNDAYSPGSPADDSSHLTVLEGPEARETAFKELAPQVEYVHVNTHGFFLSEECMSASAPGLQQYGLVFADVGTSDGGDDGILTPKEIAALDLSRVVWAVLAACSSGVGETTSGEGVLGFRRAFQVAGTRTLIASLLDVDAYATIAWMEALYRARFRDNMSTVDAVRQATLQTMQEEAYEHPFYWGAFVASGDWR